MATIRVLSPVVDSKISQTAALPLPGTLAGKRLGFLDNTKANFELLLRRLEAILRTEAGIADVVYEQVKALPEPLAREVLDFVAFLR